MRLFSGSQAVGRQAATKRQRKEKNRSFLPPGYVLGDIITLQNVYKLLSGGEVSLAGLSLSGLKESRYLRFWSGRNSDLSSIWEEISDPIEHLIRYEQLPLLLSRLDAVSMAVREEMERENVEWMHQDLEHDMLSLYFARNNEEGFIGLPAFLAWDKVRSEMWYNEKSLSVEAVTQLWKTAAGASDAKVNFEEFCALYQQIRSVEYVV